jgi:hypothetical protein
MTMQPDLPGDLLALAREDLASAEALDKAERVSGSPVGGDGARLTEILDGIPGSWERAQVSIKQARRGETVPLSEL